MEQYIICYLIGLVVTFILSYFLSKKMLKNKTKKERIVLCVVYSLLWVVTVIPTAIVGAMYFGGKSLIELVVKEYNKWKSED